MFLSKFITLDLLFKCFYQSIFKYELLPRKFSNIFWRFPKYMKYYGNLSKAFDMNRNFEFSKFFGVSKIEIRFEIPKTLDRNWKYKMTRKNLEFLNRSLFLFLYDPIRSILDPKSYLKYEILVCQLGWYWYTWRIRSIAKSYWGIISDTLYYKDEKWNFSNYFVFVLRIIN